MGKMGGAILGARWRAGLIAYPVGPPSESPTPHTRLPTRYGPSPAAGPAADTFFEKIANTTNTRANVAMASLKKFAGKSRIAGEFKNTPRFPDRQLLSSQSGKKVSQPR